MTLALSGCGRKPDVNAEAPKAEESFAMKEAPTPTQAPAENVTATPEPQADVKSEVKSALSAVHSNEFGTGVLATQNVQQAAGVSTVQRIGLQQVQQATTATSSVQAEGKTRLGLRRTKPNDAN
jgi:hypothetical protein